MIAMKFIQLYCCLSIMVVGSLFISCEKFLDAKPAAKSVIPKKVSDLRAMLDYQGHVNSGTGNVMVEYYSDYVRIDEEDLDRLAVFNRELYTFGQAYETESIVLGMWTSGYRPIYIANNVLELLPIVSENQTEEARRVKGTAHFLRANYMFHQAKVFSPLYVKGDEQANAKLSIPIRLASDVTAISSRATVAEVYAQMVSDFETAIQLLPAREQYLTRPDKASAYACLSRLYLTMQEYDKAGLYADSSLRIYDTLIDYNEIDRTALTPFPVQHEEVLFFSTSNSTDFLNPADGSYIDPDFVDLYHDDDLRKETYFMFDERGRFQFKGNYVGGNYGSVLPDPAVDEMYLTLSESHARAGNVEQAMETLNRLLVKRWRQDTFEPLTAGSAEEALTIVLLERRKSLVFRGVRTLDQRRLNLEPRFAQAVRRTLGSGDNQQEYILEPNDPRYVFLIPLNVIEITGMPQNER